MTVATWLVLFGIAASNGRVITFDTGPLGKTPPDWLSVANHGRAPQWEIRRDNSAATQPYVLAQVSAESGRDRMPLAILKTMTLRDGDLSVRIKPISGREVLGGGLVWRYRDENNYYLARASALEKNVVVYKVQNGQRTPLLTVANHDIPANDWTILKVSLRGSRYQVYLDHRRILQGYDNTFTGSGHVGLCTVADSVAYFDDFRVYPK
ncbi:MAG TPA: hypothetical protein VMJ75_28305 [Candidatus Acidoferrales bacterium]|nr:hypothetical protein [Candidatus Acidoferrales bacterium]HXK02538.1 hypothetical protein [Verrucomicrobiae bacterium]